ncbi:MAG: type II toxin-antitoxin system death-on-curing family toxin [Hyphomonas sp.]|uniref:type II toxin-antitoxin system death-on-curing family toxin n=1 Tax=Hyphomonas sp. TaxID=87 RepID=UPI00181F5FBE|nr:type II toxin-antitoxin system death-on-curing family toxin [Hyphomonas sp.]MBU3919272.1 type II toxin-antitoxin system death-on-curing family toxin [Alphaproteobacteria bacterium]MBA3068475.1 type II toxin-antitoxin system death-on-curing family toxin [Hyphomonas sp.]MBU4060658.1 type II toxin-antitoxin system death-on-curing family toxin [Alphaproteobacteria bacterium]MBU4164642.1 type II toxin-antitoxin system death-on-curing family toxin [Alphaproteobacteria bacterium]MBU4567890.1 type 
MTRPKWLPEWLVYEVHEDQIAEHGGAAGVRDAGLLDSALARPLNAFAYGVEDIFDLAALYAAGVVKNHPFVDGNKRTGFILSELFLNANGWSLDAADDDVIASVLLLAGGEWDEQNYAAWLRENASRTAA